MISEHLRSLRLAGWLGWQLESNWTEPWLFAVYVLIKPFCSSLLLVFMYYAARTATGVVPLEFLPYLYVSNACFGLVGAVMYGMSQAVISDREHYRMLKYIYISPARLPSYFIGRGMARAVQALLGAAINLSLGYAIFPEVRAAVRLEYVAWGWLLVDIVLGVCMLIALGLLLAGVVLNMSRYGSFLGESVASVLFLLSGAVFPLSVLPGWLQGIGLSLPPTYWLEAMRRAILGTPAEVIRSPLAHWSQADLAGMLAVTTAGLLVVSLLVFHLSERAAWRRGRLEETTGV